MELVLPQIQEVMSSPAVIIGEEQTVGLALSRMRERDIRRLPVVSGQGTPNGEVADGAKLVGIITRGDARQAAGAEGEASTAAVRGALSAPVHTVQAKDLVDRAVTLMHIHKVGALPVLRYGNLVGVITESDVFRWLAGLLDLEGQASWQ